MRAVLVVLGHLFEVVVETLPQATRTPEVTRDREGFWHVYQMSGTAADGYGGIVLEFEFGWDKTKIMADVRDGMNNAVAKFPEGAEQYSINEINFSEFPILIVNLTGDVPERTMNRIAKDLHDDLGANLTRIVYLSQRVNATTQEGQGSLRHHYRGSLENIVSRLQIGVRQTPRQPQQREHEVK